MKFEFFDVFQSNNQISDCVNIRPLRAEFFHDEGQRESHDEDNSTFSRFCKSA